MYLRVLMMFFMLLLIPFTANASDSINDFEVEVLPVEGQKNFSEGYFHVDSEPGKTLSLEFRIENKSKAPINLNAQAVDAHTADKGGILYSAESADNEQERISMSELIAVQNTITVAPGAVESVHFHLEIPESASGTILGGIMLTSIDAPDNLSMESMNKGGSNYTFEQPGQRLMAVKLNLPEKSITGFSLKDAKFDARANRVTMKVNNGKATVLENVQATYTVMDKEGAILVSGVVKPFAMAPLSKIDFPIEFKGKSLEKGKYVLMIKGRAGEKEFLTEEKFTVTDSLEAGALSETIEKTTPINQQNLSRVIAITLATLFLLLPLMLKLNKRNEKNAL